MRRSFFSVCLLGLALTLASALQRPADADGAEAVHVTNFPAVQAVAGAVEVPAPIPHTQFVVERAQVSPGDYDNPTSYFDAGVVDTAGFTSVTLSLAGEVQGRLSGPAEVGVVLIPEGPETLAALRVHGIQQFPIRLATRIAPSPSGLFQSEQLSSRLGFPRYRVFFYNQSPRTVDATVYLYLAN